LLLITEDNDDVRFYIKQNLQQEYRIIEAADGEDGWNKSIENLPDLIISDVMMPKMDGFKFCAKLKTDERTSHTPAVLLTAKAAKEDKLEGYETGADDYIMKPFDTDELKARIKNLIEQRKRLHEHFQKEGSFELNQAKITPVDKKFLQKAYSIISQNISNEFFSVETFAKNLSVSRSLLHKKITALTGEPPVEFIRRIRLNKAAKLIESKFGNLSEIALEVGFSNPAYFSECFKKQFGVPPSQYQRNNKTL
jgi:DNA-binding response OmpR family regulator